MSCPRVTARRASRRVRTTADQLLQIAAAMLHELRPGAPIRTVHLDEHHRARPRARQPIARRARRPYRARLRHPLAGASGDPARTPRDLLDAIAQAEPVTGAAPLPQAPAPLPDPVLGTPEPAATIIAAFHWHLERHPDREHITLIEGDEAATNHLLRAPLDRCGRGRTGLTAMGIGRGDAEAVYVALRDAFDSVKRQLEEVVREKRGTSRPANPPTENRNVYGTRSAGRMGRVQEDRAWAAGDGKLRRSATRSRSGLASASPTPRRSGRR